MNPPTINLVEVEVHGITLCTFRVEVRVDVDYGDGKGPMEEWLPCGVPFSTTSQAEHTKENVARQVLKTLRELYPAQTYRLVKMTHSTEHYTRMEVIA